MSEKLKAFFIGVGSALLAVIAFVFGKSLSDHGDSASVAGAELADSQKRTDSIKGRIDSVSGRIDKAESAVDRCQSILEDIRKQSEEE